MVRYLLLRHDRLPREEVCRVRLRVGLGLPYLGQLSEFVARMFTLYIP